MNEEQTIKIFKKLLDSSDNLQICTSQKKNKK